MLVRFFFFLFFFFAKQELFIGRRLQMVHHLFKKEQLGGGLALGGGCHAALTEAVFETTGESLHVTHTSRALSATTQSLVGPLESAHGRRGV